MAYVAAWAGKDDCQQQMCLEGKNLITNFLCCLFKNMWICGGNIKAETPSTTLTQVVTVSTTDASATATSTVTATASVNAAVGRTVRDEKPTQGLFQRLFSRRKIAAPEQGSQTDVVPAVIDKKVGTVLDKSDLTVSFSLHARVPDVPGFIEQDGKVHFMFGSGSKGDLTKLRGRELVQKIRELDGWMGLLLKRPCLHREFVFANLNTAVMFVYVVSAEANIMRHYPKINMVFNRVSITLRTAIVNGITNRDIALAQTINGMANLLASGAIYK